MALSLDENATNEDVIDLLREANLENLVDAFEENQVDGEDFFGLELMDINSLIPVLKTRKRFISMWSRVTGKKFDANGAIIPCKEETTPNGSSKKSNISNDDSGSDEPSEILHLETNVTVTPWRSPRKRSGSPLPGPSAKRALMSVSKTSPSLSKSQMRDQQKQASLSPKSPNIQSRKGSNTADDGSWLKNFSIPTRWERAVEDGLERKSLTPDEKSALTRQLCTMILTYTDSPKQAERDQIAIMLIKKFPFLSGSFGLGHQFWSKKIKERMLNLKRKASRQERKKFQAEGGEVVKGKPGRKKNVQQQKYSVVPAIPQGETTETIKKMKQNLKELCKSGSSDQDKIKQLMDATYCERRRSILVENVRVWELLKEYPPLQEKKGQEIRAEFERIVGGEVKIKDIREKLNINRTSLLAGLKKINKKEVKDTLLLLEEHDSNDEIEMEMRCIMACLPYAVGEKKNSSSSPGEMFWKIVKEDDDVTGEITKTASPRLLSTGTVLDVQSLCLAAEGMVVCNFKPNNRIANAVITLLSSYYTFNASYPKGVSKNIYLFLEHLLLEVSNSSLPIGVENWISTLK